MVEFFFRRIYRVKHHLLYAAIAQIVLMAVNVLILLSSNFEIPYTVFHSVVPTYFYLLFITLFYLLIHKLNQRFSRQTFFTTILTYIIIAVNVAYTILTTFDESGALYYMDTVIVQVINAFYMMVYVTTFGKQYALQNQLSLLRIFSYGAAITSILSFYFCYVNMLVAWSFIIVTTVLLFITYLLMHENFKKSLPKKKVLRSRASK